MQSKSLAEFLERLHSINSYIQVQIGQEQGDDWFSHDEFIQPNSPQLEMILQRISSQVGCDDRHFLATSFIASYCWQMTAVGVLSFLSVRRVPDFSPQNLRLHIDQNAWHDKLALATDHFYALPDDPEAGHAHVSIVEDIDALRACLRTQIEAHMTGIIDALKIRTGMGKRGMWGIVADRFAGNLLHAAKTLGHEDLCKHEIAGLVQVTGSALKGKTGMMVIEYEGRSETFLQRGACCNYYKAPGYGYCSTCPRQRPEEIVERLRESMTAKAH